MPDRTWGHITDQQSCATVATVYTTTISRVSIVKTAGHSFIVDVSVTKELHVVSKISAEVCPQLVVVFDFGRTPNLSRVSDVLITRGDQTRSIPTLYRAVSRFSTAPLCSKVNKATVANTEAFIGGENHRRAIAFTVLAILRFKGPISRRIFEVKVNHTSDRIRSVLSSGTVAQHFDAAKGE